MGETLFARKDRDRISDPDLRSIDPPLVLEEGASQTEGESSDFHQFTRRKTSQNPLSLPLEISRVETAGSLNQKESHNQVYPSLTETLPGAHIFKYPKVRQRLQMFWKKWQEAGADPWVVSVLREGYSLKFQSKPKLSKVPMWNLQNTHPQVHQEIQDLLQKGALEEVKNPNSPGFYSRIFLVPKPGNKWRPVIDLKNLNRYLIYEKVKWSLLRQ